MNMSNPYGTFLDQTAPMSQVNAGQFGGRYPFQQPQQPQPMPQAPINGLIRVTGLDGATAYQMPPNSVQALFDGGKDVMYIKTTDGAGFPTIKTFTFAPFVEQQAQPIPTGDFVTKQEFDELKELVEASVVKKTKTKAVTENVQ